MTGADDGAGAGAALLERAAAVLAAAAARWQEFADAVALVGRLGSFVGLAAEAYAAQVAAAGDGARQRAAWLRRVAQECWVAADLARAGGPVDLGVVDEITRRDLLARAAVDADLVAGRTRSADGLLDGAEVSTWRNARAVAAAVEGREAVVWAYDPTAHGGHGEVVVGVGDVRSDGPARHVVLVPGVGTEVVDAPRQVARVETVVAAAREQGAGATSGWFWLGYDTPDGPGDPAMLTTARAQAGGEALAVDLARLQAAHGNAGGTSDWTVVGHSYGATTVAEAAAGSGPELDVDAVVLVGAPGAGPAQEAADLGVSRVFVGRDSRDVVATVGAEGWVAPPGLGRDPASEEFGAFRFRAERLDREPWRGWGEAHTGYFTRGTESVDNIGAVVAGAYARVEVAESAFDPWWGRPRDPEWMRSVG